MRIHHSAFDRIRSGATAYAPIGLPQNYEVVLQDGSIALQGTPPSEIPAQAAQRLARQQGAWNFVWWRRLLYFLTVAATIHLVAFPLFYGVDSAREYTTRLRLIPEILRIAGEFLPGFVTTWWIDSFATNPFKFLVSVIAIIVPILLGLRLGTATQDRMLAAWRGTEASESWLTQALDVVQAFRTAAWYRAGLLAIKYKLTPVLFALLSVAIVGLLASHLAFYFEDAAGMTCHQSANVKKLLSEHRTPELTFDPKSECWASGIILTRGVRYVISLKTSEDWADGNYRANAGGYGIDTLPSWWDRGKMIVTVPLRRVLLRPWFRIIARVGETGTDEYFLDQDANDVRSLEIPFVAHRTGELYLYVNDAVLPVRKDLFYRNNKGTATLTVTQKDKH